MKKAEIIFTLKIEKLYTLNMLSLCSNQKGKVSLVNWMNNYHLKKYREQGKSLLRVQGRHEQQSNPFLVGEEVLGRTEHCQIPS